MSENENVSGTTGNAGQGAGAGNGWGWEPVPQGGEYDNEATAFVQLPQEMLDALDSGEPLAAPGHGFVPPPMIVPLGSGSADPSATGTWTMPVQWPDAGSGTAPGAAGSGPSAGAAAQAPARAPIPASIPLPASVAAAFAAAPAGEAEAEPQNGSAHAEQAAGGAHGTLGGGLHFDPSGGAVYGEPSGGVPHGEPQGGARLHGEPQGASHAGLLGEPHGGPHAAPQGGPFGAHPAPHGGVPHSDPHAAPQGGPHGTLGGGLHTGPHADPYADPHAEPDPGATAEWHFPEAVHRPEDAMATGQWTLPGGAGDPALDGGWGGPAGGTPAPWEQPAAPEAAPGVLLSSGVLPGGAAGAPAAALSAGRGPRVLGGPGVGTPLPEGYLQAGPEPEAVPAAPPDIEASHGPAEMPVEGERSRPVEADGGAEGAETAGPAFAEPPAAAPAEAEAAPVPGDGGADSGATPPAEGDTGSFPVQETAYEEERIPAVAQHEHPSASYVLRVNGADRPVTGAWIGESLLYVLRERLGLAGAKDGCSQGECGACAVQVDGRLVASCLVPAATAAGSEVRTVEGLASGGELSDVQQALCRSGGVQCGFCVPGMAMTIHDLLEGNHAPSDLETRQALCGNLCRCSGYKGVIEAVREVVAEREATAAEADALIPHQAQPGEGGIHAAHGTDGFDPFGSNPGSGVFDGGQTAYDGGQTGYDGGQAAFDGQAGPHGTDGRGIPTGHLGPDGFPGPDGPSGPHGPDGLGGLHGNGFGGDQHNGGMA
ncbi:2Fe-2S iron-sulfur cluster-binding protein [Streptomyces racemochromogenes]|uniref:2Fe-2S iron-sulfur cluster-binding protein n=1 Tax=Streptomyces racemochromogenes TaxID=67353 RepID=UPI0031EF32AC